MAAAVLQRQVRESERREVEQAQQIKAQEEQIRDLMQRNLTLSSLLTEAREERDTAQRLAVDSEEKLQQALQDSHRDVASLKASFKPRIRQLCKQVQELQKQCDDHLRPAQEHERIRDQRDELLVDKRALEEHVHNLEQQHDRDSNELELQQEHLKSHDDDDSTKDPLNDSGFGGESDGGPESPQIGVRHLAPSPPPNYEEHLESQVLANRRDYEDEINHNPLNDSGLSDELNEPAETAETAALRDERCRALEQEIAEVERWRDINAATKTELKTMVNIAEANSSNILKAKRAGFVNWNQVVSLVDSRWQGRVRCSLQVGTQKNGGLTPYKLGSKEKTEKLQRLRDELDTVRLAKQC
eukprot:m.251848 g.251848  ORF g.251848 m.251848 type:complete len:357 (+) comp19117_c0_seq1:164-1234(+)